MAETTTDPSINEVVYDYHGREQGDVDFDNDFVGIAGRASRRAGNLPKPPQIDTQLDTKPNKSRGKKVGETITAVATLGGLGALGIWAAPEIIDDVNGIQYSDTSVGYSVAQGDSLENFLLEHVKGAHQVSIDDLETHVMADPANINVFPEGKDSSADLEPGMIITVPESVSD